MMQTQRTPRGLRSPTRQPKTLPLDEGDNVVHVRVKSENGYEEEDHDGVYTVHRDVDTRLRFLNVFPTTG